MLMKDDGLRTDYTIVYKILSGGVVNGKQYPGVYFTDGTGKKINYKYSFAINANDDHSTSPNATTWAQMIEIVSKGHSLMNHSMFHGGTDKLKALKDAENNLWNHTHYRMTELVPPGADEGFTATGIQLGYSLISSEFGEPVPDGNNSPGNENVYWGSYIPMLAQNKNRILVSRTNLGDQWNDSELLNAKSYIDYIFKHPQIKQKLIGAAFSHGPFADNKESAKIFAQFITYIHDHPNNRDSAWITSSKELTDYLKTKSQVIVKSQNYNSENGIYKIVFDMNNIDRNVIYRNISLKLEGALISNASVEGAKEVTFNPSTGLVNIYKTDRSRVKSPLTDLLPPQIVSIKGSGYYVDIVYNKAVSQTKKEAYEISGNSVLLLNGSKKNWRLKLKDQLKPDQNFSYRMQRGDAHQESNPLQHVCSYISSKIESK